MEVLWKSEPLKDRKCLKHGSRESGGFREDIITRKEDFANRGEGEFAEWLRSEHDPKVWKMGCVIVFVIRLLPRIISDFLQFLSITGYFDMIYLGCPRSAKN